MHKQQCFHAQFAQQVFLKLTTSELLAAYPKINIEPITPEGGILHHLGDPADHSRIVFSCAPPTFLAEQPAQSGGVKLQPVFCTLSYQAENQVVICRCGSNSCRFHLKYHGAEVMCIYVFVWL